MNAIGTVVSDMDAAIAFYAKLGLDFTVDARRSPKLMLETETSGPRRRRAGNAVRQAAGLSHLPAPDPGRGGCRVRRMTTAGYRGLRAP